MSPLKKIIQAFKNLSNEDRLKFLNKVEKVMQKDNKKVVKLLNKIEAGLEISYSRATLKFPGFEHLIFDRTDSIKKEKTKEKMREMYDQHHINLSYCHNCFETDADMMRLCWDGKYTISYRCHSCDKTFCENCITKVLDKYNDYYCSSCLDE